MMPIILAGASVTIVFMFSPSSAGSSVIRKIILSASARQGSSRSAYLTASPAYSFDPLVSLMFWIALRRLG